jgi:hypothetical protein
VDLTRRQRRWAPRSTPGSSELLALGTL